MQLLLSAVLALLVVGPAVCWPYYRPMMYGPQTPFFERAGLQREMEGSPPPPYMNEQANSQSNYYNPYFTAESQGE